MAFFHTVFLFALFLHVLLHSFILFPFLGVKTVARVPAHCLAEGAVKVTGGVSSISLDCP